MLAIAAGSIPGTASAAAASGWAMLTEAGRRKLLGDEDSASKAGFFSSALVEDTLPPVALDAVFALPPAVRAIGISVPTFGEINLEAAMFSSLPCSVPCSRRKLA
jgi:hypothetical protein